MLLLRHPSAAAVAARLAARAVRSGSPSPLAFGRPGQQQQEQHQQQRGRIAAAAAAARTPAAPHLRRPLVIATYASSARGTTSSALLTPADHQAIVQLLHRFDDYLNRGKHAELGGFFVDGSSSGGSTGNGNARPLVPIVRILPPGAPSPIVQEGLPAILAWFTKCAPMAQGNRHLLLNSIVEPGGGEEGGAGSNSPARAIVRSSRLLVSATTPPALRASGVVEDVLVRVGLEWRLLSRDLLMDPPPPSAAPAA
jgi:hypothetical protein